MLQAVETRINDLRRVCERGNVRRLSLFGSAATATDDRMVSDLDFLVEFRPMTPSRHADAFFSLQEELERLFAMPVDLVEPGPIRNPYFREAIEKSKVALYDAP
jgi:hypothetical protein